MIVCYIINLMKEGGILKNRKKKIFTWTVIAITVVLAIALAVILWFAANPKYTVTFDLNGGTMNITETEVRYGIRYDFPTPTKEGYVFAGWSLNGNSIEPKGVWNLKEDVTLVAVWELRDESGIVYEPKDNGYVAVDYKGVATKTVIVPKSFRGKPVIGINDDAFDRFNDLTDSLKTKYATVYYPSNITYNKESFEINSRVRIVKYDYIKDGEMLFADKEDTVALVGYVGEYYETTVIVPTEYDGKPVSEIAPYVFYESTKFINHSSNSFSTRVMIPESVKTVGEYAFSDCKGLKVSLYYPHETDGFREIVTLERLFSWVKEVEISKGNDEFIDVITIVRPAFGWMMFTHARLYVSLNANGGVVKNDDGIKINGVEMIINQENYVLPVPTREGYDFDGWYNGDKKIEASGEKWPYFEHIELTAKWIEK